MLGDTIAAIATGAAPGGVGVVRVSGPRAVAAVAAVVGVAPAQLDRSVRYGIARDAAGARLDEVLAFAMRAPKSFTGEDVAEIHGHGGAVNMAQLLAAVLAQGVRAAEPGEFTRRAFENGKVDLTRAEALLAVIEAGSARALRVNQEMLSGALARALDVVEQRATEVLAEIEGCIDFPEDDLVLRENQWVRDELRALAGQCEQWVGSFSTGKALRNGITVALVGPVNVGKSSLLNALVGQRRALVSAQPGTTRDYVEARVEWDGVAVTIIDTAGQRSAEDAIEAEGIALGVARAQTADVVLRVFDDALADDDATDANPEARVAGADTDALAASRWLYVRSKADLASAAGAGGEALGVTPGDAPAAPVSSAARNSSVHVLGVPGSRGLPGALGATAANPIVTSATTGVGLDVLRARILAEANIGTADGDDGVMLITERQRARALEAARKFAAAHDGIAANLPIELVALEVRQAVHALAEMRGKEVTERVLDEVFARFCIGK